MLDEPILTAETFGLLEESLHEAESLDQWTEAPAPVGPVEAVLDDEEFVDEPAVDPRPTLEERHYELVDDVAELFAAEQAARSVLAEELATVSTELAAEQAARSALSDVVDGLAARLAELEAAARAPMVIAEDYIGPERRTSAERRRGLRPRDGRRTAPLRAERDPEPVAAAVEEPELPDVEPEPQHERLTGRLDEVVGNLGSWQDGELDRLRQS